MKMPQWRRTLYILLVVQILSTAGFSLVFPFLPLYVSELGVASFGSIEFWSGLVFSSQAITMMISAPIWGTIADRYGRKPMLIRASLGGAVILAAMGFVQNAEQLALLRTIQGFITGTMAASSALVAATAPRERSGEALGLLRTGSWIGVAVGPLIGGVIGDAFGFRESFWITSVLLAISGFAVLFWVQEDFQPVAKEEQPGFFSGYKTLLRAPDMASLYSATFLLSLGRSVILPVASLFVMDLMASSDGVATVTGILMGSKALIGSVCAVWMGRLSDRLGHGKVLVMAAVVAIVLYLPQPFVTSAWQLVLLQALTGVAYGGMMPAIGALMNLRTPKGAQGATFGLDNSVNAAARTIAPMLGAGVAVWFGMRGVFGVAVFVYAAAALVAVHIWRSGMARRVPAPIRTASVPSGD